MTGKRVKDTSIVMAQVMTQQDSNIAGNVHGGVIMRLIDNAGGVVAARHAQQLVVTASIDRLDFHNPVFIGDVVTLKTSINYVGRTSMEVGVRVESETILTGEKRHTASAYLTYVALDKNGKPLVLPPLISETKVEKRRNREAKARRESRLAQRKSKQ
jgi:uncharacterized protein (TIGR00369 family)